MFGRPDVSESYANKLTKILLAATPGAIYGFSRGMEKATQLAEQGKINAICDSISACFDKGTTEPVLYAALGAAATSGVYMAIRPYVSRLFRRRSQ